MNRYRSYGERDDQPQVVGDGAFLGVDEYNAAENIRQGNVQKAVNHDFTAQDANTRGGFVCLPELGNNSFGQRWDFVEADRINLRDVTYGQGLWVAVGDTVGIRTSPDAITWTDRTSPLTSGTFIDVVFANSVFVAVVSSAPNRAIWSSDGIIWNLPTIEPAITGGAGIAYGNGKWVISAATSSSISTDNGVTWTSYSFTSIGTVTGLSFTNGLFVATTATGAAYSADAISWISVAFGPNGTPRDICFFGTKFYLVTSTGAIYSSPTAQTWTLERAAPGGAIHDAIVATDSFMVTLGLRSSLCESVVSLNGTEWQVTPVGVNTRAFGMGYGNGMVVGVGPNQGAIRSQSIVPAIFASGLFSDPLEKDRPWIMAVATDKVGFFAFGKASKTVSLGSYRVTEQSTIVQANNYVYLFRGEDETPLRWDGSWDNDFELVPNTTLPSSFSSIPNSSQATYYQNRLWVLDGKDTIAASDVLSFTDYDPRANEFNLNTGNSDYVVATFPFGVNTLIVFKNKSIIALNNVEGSLLDVTATEVTRQIGLVGPNALTSVGPDLAYVSYGDINLLTLTATNNAVQHKTLPLSARIRKIMSRVNWEVGYKISMGYWNNELYVALPLDNSQVCDTVVVYNFITDQWYGEWNFSPTMNMCIQGWQVVDYLGLQRLHAITEDGRIFVTDEGQNDISGTTVAEISSEMVTRAYAFEEGNHLQRRIYLDLATNRPKFSCSVYTEGANEESVLLTDQTYTRAESWKWEDSAYDLTNANNDYNRAYRKDYSSGPDSIQTGSGFQPEMPQEFRIPLLVRRQGRLSWIKITNTQGFISVMSLTFEMRPGQRSNLIQV